MRKSGRLEAIRNLAGIDARITVRRRVLLLSRDEALRRLEQIHYAEITRTIRQGIAVGRIQIAVGRIQEIKLAVGYALAWEELIVGSE